MDPSAVNVNLTVDDFDSIISYPDQSLWQTPDPSSPSFNPSASPWWEGTYHTTDVINASLSFNFTGPAIYVYGGSGPAFGLYEVELDGSRFIFSAYSDSTAVRRLLYANNKLPYAQHSLSLRNLGTKDGLHGGNSFLFDSLHATVQVAPAGATVSNSTIEETSPSLTYTGTWYNNSAQAFSGGGTAFTNESASVSLDFHASAIYVFGDKTNNHGLYSVTLDSDPAQIFDGVSGCGGFRSVRCELQRPGLKFFASNLDEKAHHIKIVNLAGPDSTYIDIDDFVLTVPSMYNPRPLQQYAYVARQLPNLASSLVFSNSLLFFVVSVVWLLKKSLGSSS